MREQELTRQNPDMNKAEMFVATTFDDIDREFDLEEEERKSSARLPIENFLDHQQDFL